MATEQLRHITSQSNLAASHRLSQHLRSSPARSPSSIPSSPTSIHSSSSAIFERDIEPLSPPSPSFHHTQDPHRIPRSRTTEQIELSVPSVLDSAASILASTPSPGTSDVAVVAPAPAPHYPGSGFASPIGSFGSRSPSPTAIHGTRSSSLLLSIPQQQLRLSVSGSPPHQSHLPVVRPTPTIQTTNGPPPTATPSIITPTSAYFSVVDESDPAEHPPSPVQPHPVTTATPSPKNVMTGLSPSSPSSHPLPSSAPNSATKRLSFLSYADLLNSAPTSTLPLSSLTTAASAVEPPPHIPSVTGVNLNVTSGFGSHPGSAGTSLRGFVLGPVNLPTLHTASSHDPFLGAPSVPKRRDSFPATEVDDLSGGEWEREGLGMGLEERLDVLYGSSPSAGTVGA